MQFPAQNDKQSSRSAAWFTTTHWSVVLAAGQAKSPHATEALENLCRTYWYPLYAYIRRRGYPTPEAQDLTQEFFARFLERNYLGQVDPQKGKFRSFLLASLNHFLANAWDRDQARKRGGGCTFIPWDTAQAENRYQRDSAPSLSADKIFERQWAIALLEQVFDRLHQEQVAAGKGHIFDQLKAYLTGEKNPVPSEEVAARLGLSQGALQVKIHRLRKRYGELLRQEIANTVTGPEEVDEEIRHLFAAFSG